MSSTLGCLAYCDLDHLECCVFVQQEFDLSVLDGICGRCGGGRRGARAWLVEHCCGALERGTEPKNAEIGPRDELSAPPEGVPCLRPHAAGKGSSTLPATRQGGGGGG